MLHGGGDLFVDTWKYYEITRNTENILTNKNFKMGKHLNADDPRHEIKCS